MDNNLVPDTPVPTSAPGNSALGHPTHGNPSANGASLIPAIRGPIMLITIGVLFALDYSVGIRFWKTWPVLLIVLGGLHLMERKGSRA